MKGDETIRIIEIVLALALLAAPAMASGADVLGTYGGIFETEESAFNFPASQDTNIESLTVGNEKAMAFNNNVSPSIGSRVANHTPCKDCCAKVNLDQISAGNREAFAFGHSSAENYVKIVTNQK